MRMTGRVFLRMSALALLWMSTTALINPNFTPVDLSKQSDVIITLEFKKVEIVKDKDGRDTAWAVGTVQKVLKGKFEPKEVKIDLLAGIVDAEGKEVMERINGGARQGIMFVGSFSEDAGDGGKPAAEVKGYVHIGGHWMDATRDKDGTWGMDKDNQLMNGTWSGGTDMLVRAINYVLADPEALLPVREGMEWNKESQIAKIDGKILRAAAVDVTGKGKSELFLAAEQGDRLFRWDGKALADITVPSGLTSKSQAFAWGDFNGDGTVDLASWDGKD